MQALIQASPGPRRRAQVRSSLQLWALPGSPLLPHVFLWPGAGWRGGGRDQGLPCGGHCQGMEKRFSSEVLPLQADICNSRVCGESVQVSGRAVAVVLGLIHLNLGKVTTFPVE